MAKGNRRQVRLRSGSHVVAIPPAFVAQLEITDGTLLEIEMTNCGEIDNDEYCLTMRVVEDDNE